MKVEFRALEITTGFHLIATKDTYEEAESAVKAYIERHKARGFTGRLVCQIMKVYTNEDTNNAADRDSADQQP